MEADCKESEKALGSQAISINAKAPSHVETGVEEIRALQYDPN